MNPQAAHLLLGREPARVLDPLEVLELDPHVLNVELEQVPEARQVLRGGLGVRRGVLGGLWTGCGRWWWIRSEFQKVLDLDDLAVAVLQRAAVVGVVVHQLRQCGELLAAVQVVVVARVLDADVGHVVLDPVAAETHQSVQTGNGDGVWIISRTPL